MKNWFKDNLHLFAAIPGLLFWAFAGTLFGVEFSKAFAFLLIMEISEDFLYKNLCRMNYFMDTICSWRPFLWLLCKILRSKNVNGFLHRYEDWLDVQSYLARSVVCVIDDVIFSFILVICLAGSLLDYIWCMIFKR
ncbi:MAG: hypothetical protein WCT49_06430 [Candidatus Paceibacterota bacterium]|jgi:hypothetical protein